VLGGAIEERRGVSLSLRIVQIDVPRHDVDVVVDFWSGALGATPVDAPGPFTHLADARSVVEVRVQAIGGGSEEIMRDLASRQLGI
jgi:hypothetical protein